MCNLFGGNIHTERCATSGCVKWILHGFLSGNLWRGNVNGMMILE